MRPSSTAFEIPRRLRALVRSRETSLVVLAALIGTAAGLVVVSMSVGVDFLHRTFFELSPGERLSAHRMLDPVRALAVPVAGGLAFGLAMALLARWRAGREVDPIEANALHGGRMSASGSLSVAGQTLWSSGVGASVGLEAGYTQLASGIASWVGRAFRLRRGDLRILVGCGAAGAIAGAFGAPLAGAFYAFELIIGSYSVASLAPVGLAALLGHVVASAFAPTSLGIIAASASAITGRDLAIAGVLGLLAAGFGIALMRGVALCEALFVRAKVPAMLRPALGGLAVGALALLSPQVMSSGHGALHLAGVLDRSLWAIALVFVLKTLASMISLGAGFRGGLFFASLLLGALGGQLFASGLGALWPALGLDTNTYAIIGMGALSVSVIGGPLTMTFIALETTGNFWLTTAVLVAVIIATQVTRETFGYSFATWRFHLRGETIRSAADVGWIRDLTVGRMMRSDVKTVPADMALPAFREAFPLGAATQVVAVDAEGHYAGLVLVSEAHAPEHAEAATIGEILRHGDDVLMPYMTIKEAVEMFDRTEAEALAVVSRPGERQVVGLLSEAHALRRYAEALELRRRDVLGQE
ncbi:chloride channel protein [Vineibacter terrae]|uniref:Chloride channel protein n=1 Tax=Vineibacter terrae TaxID=2586908 RepID=A0A5C8PRV7_9HYPH|nr:chloride channel protein [Vineibacter terrae]TXL78880.1 chloride channel protein [Vineibacter terrae]